MSKHENDKTTSDLAVDSVSAGSMRSYRLKAYRIYRDGRRFGEFFEGGKTRTEGRKVDEEWMLQEFRDCIETWDRQRPNNRYEWELRISIPSNSKD